MVGASRYDELARAIADAYPTLPNRLQGLARYALDNPDAMALATVAEIARDADVPPSAVIRFANAMGYDGRDKHFAVAVPDTIPTANLTTLTSNVSPLRHGT